jgi:hypothetical protein
MTSLCSFSRLSSRCDPSNPVPPVSSIISSRNFDEDKHIQKKTGAIRLTALS